MLAGWTYIIVDYREIHPPCLQSLDNERCQDHSSDSSHLVVVAFGIKWVKLTTSHLVVVPSQKELLPHRGSPLSGTHPRSEISHTFHICLSLHDQHWRIRFVRPHVWLQVVGSCKSLVTLCARVALLCHRFVDCLVLFHCRLCWKTFATEGAEKRARSVCVLPLSVCNQSTCGVESLTTVVTFIRTRSWVDPHVSAKGHLLVEGFTTCVAHKGPVARVNPGIENLSELRSFM